MNKEIGQLIITGITGKTLNENEREFLRDCNIGGVILFAHNYDGPAQLAELVNQIQECRDERPLFISVDQEGGRVKRFKTHFLQLPPMGELGKKNSPKLTFELHEALGKQLVACGVNLNYSPCCDILTNKNNTVIGDRAFGSDLDTVEKHVSAAIRGLRSGKVLTCAKHFPGHGGTTKDSHFDLPYVKTSLDIIESRELIPFTKASRAKAQFMMMAHLVVDVIDSELPCSLSTKAYSYLRDKTKFDGIIITDDMEMGAIIDHHSTEKASVMAIVSGADMIIYRTSAEARKAHESLQNAYTKKEFSKKMLDEKLKRINACKDEYLTNYHPIHVPDIHQHISEEINQEFYEKISPTTKIQFYPGG